MYAVTVSVELKVWNIFLIHNNLYIAGF